MAGQHQVHAGLDHIIESHWTVITLFLLMFDFSFFDYIFNIDAFRLTIFLDNSRIYYVT